MEDLDKVSIPFTKKELEVLIHAVGSAAPIIEDEVVQFKLYHKLVFKLNECK